ncbi:chaplin [Streptomyces sp. NPDC051576]|uniref:chaplin n=1 Tax=Streptomyces sp. NPDC051576 TaxID=3155803 RepID=UPI00342A1FA6
MKRVTRNGVIAFAAASGAMAVAGPAFADSVADGTAAGSPGVISGNTVQLPVHVPVNVCGNTVNVVGLLNPAAGNRCANEGGAKKGRGGENPDGPSGGAAAQGDGKDSPGVLSSNGVQLPIHLPVNVSGNSVNVVGVGNPSVGNQSGNTSGDHPRHHPPRPTPEPPAPSKPHPAPEPGAQMEPHHTSPAAEASLAHTGADDILPAAATSAALLLGGAALYRRFRPRAGR